MNQKNEFGQEIGYPLGDWQVPAFPEARVLEGQYVRLEPLTIRHAHDLFEAYSQDDGSMWTYMGSGPFPTLEGFKNWVETMTGGADPQFYALIDKASAKALGVASYLRIDPKAGSIEVGHIAYSPRLQKTRAATEAMYLLMKNVFEMGYRRYEWKCDALNQKSRHAAARLGFIFEGIFRQAIHYKGRNRDTAWFAVIDKDWPSLEKSFQTWLNPDNFDSQGEQKSSLSSLTRGER
ncbi:MAG: GNAT family N-acetyltransferase [Trueperaceae bacterium]|nr:GNAT family N-acetyltransferase [Trueperaceae bacterium]